MGKATMASMWMRKGKEAGLTPWGDRIRVSSELDGVTPRHVAWPRTVLPASGVQWHAGMLVLSCAGFSSIMTSARTP